MIITLKCLKDINLTPLPHQLTTARRVIEQMDGRAILADEVGLGKTIEAGLVLKEYLVRGLVKKFIILVPASLGFQWTSEMVDKFKIEKIFFNRKGRGWAYFDYQIASLDMAKRRQHARFLQDIDFDMVIVDEAHHLKNSQTLNWKFVNSLNTRYCLLLTATPLQNNIRELYNLISIVDDSLYRDFRDFKARYFEEKNDRQYVIDSQQLEGDLGELMIRNNHRDTLLKFTRRNIHQILVELTPEERELYKKVTDYVRGKYLKRQGRKKCILDLLTYQRELCSSVFALQKTLARKEDKNSGLKEIYQLSLKIKSSAKGSRVLEILQEIKSQVIIFTEYRATQSYLAHYLEKQGFSTILFNGGISAAGKEWIKEIFRRQKEIMISTEAGSQGLNLQFVSTIINYDLPWNPMKLEQRIGRIHRLGQTRDVDIYNLATANTIEERILKILYRKIFLVKEVIGDLEAVLLDTARGKGFQGNIMEILMEDEAQNSL
ncbi:MAG: DEAD/DEAH box helicase [Bacillota bacterium]